MPAASRTRRLRSTLFAAAAACLGAPATARAQEASAATSTTVATPTTDMYLGDDGQHRSFSASYREGYKPGRRETHFKRTLIEMVPVIGIGLLFYYTNPKNKEDWDYPNAGERFKHLRFTFDTNAFKTDVLHHPIGGAVYYLLARTNGLSIPYATAYSVLSSLAWEMFAEVREKPSINDMVFTPMMGMPMAETFTHLGDYFNSTPGKPRWYHEVFGFLFGPIHRLHRAIDGYQRPTSSMPADKLGYSSFYAHRFDVLAGPMRVQNNAGGSATAVQVRVAAEMISVPGFLRPGRFSLNFHDGEFVEALAQFNFGNDASAWDLLFDANLIGRYGQNIAEGTRSGVASMFAFNSSARYANRTLLGRRDNYAMAHLAGPAVKLWAVHGDLVARFDATAHFDFAAVRSLAFPGYSQRFGEDGVASVLRAERYYFGLGWSGLARGTLSYKAFEVGGRAFFGQYGSLDRWDRFPDQVPDAVHTTDRIAELEGWAGIVPRDFPLQLRAFYEHIPRSSTMASVTTTRWDRRYGITIGGNL